MATTVQSSGAISITDIKPAFPSTNANDLNSYRGKPWYKPADGSFGTFSSGAISMSDFYGTTEMSMAPIHISASANNICLKSKITGYTSNSTTVLVYIDSGVKIGSTSPATPSFYIRGFGTGDRISVINNGIISGAGGAGGSGGYGDGAGNAGGVGGTAVKVCAPASVSFQNNGSLKGGGGGGGGGSGYKLYNGYPCYSYTSHTGSTGSGGAGIIGGSGSNAGTELTGGSRTSGCEYGGKGGDIGQTGCPGGGGKPGSGGLAGFYVDGINNLVGSAITGTGSKVGRSQ